MALPTNVGKGTVRVTILDGAGNPVRGSVDLEPVVKRLTNVTAQPGPVTILPTPVSILLVEGTGVRDDVIATDDPDNNPTDWNWRATFKLLDGAKADPFEFKLPEGADVDLSVVAPVASAPGVQIIRGAGVPDHDGVPDGQVIMLVDGEPAWGEPTGGGSGGVSSWDDLTDKPTTFPPATHTHTDLAAAIATKADASALAAKADTAAVTSALAGKANTSHSHGIADLPAGTVVRAHYNDGWPARPTSRTDISVEWTDLTGEADPNVLPAGYIEGSDTMFTPDLIGG